MKFSYSKKRLYLNLGLGILWLGIGISYIFEQDDNLKFKPYIISILGIIYILFFIFEFRQKYFEITEDKIKIKSILGKEINLNELTEANYYADDFTFKSLNKSLKIKKSQIDKHQLPEFENFFNNIKYQLSMSAQ